MTESEHNRDTAQIEADVTDTSRTQQKKRALPGQILLTVGILVLLLLLIAGGLFLSALRRLRGEEQIPIVSRDVEYIMETMEDTVHYIDDPNDLTAAPVTEEPPVPTVTDADTETTGPKETEAAVPEQVPIFEQNQNNKDVLNVLLLGRDSRNAAVEYGRTDSMIILSYNKKTKEVRMVSLLRDIYIPIEGHGWNRINTAYAFGGIGLCINTVNDVFGLDIQNYVTIDFNGLVSVIDSIGGIELQLTADEVCMYREMGLLGSDATAGVHHLDGNFALSHARNRTLGSDFERTRRQRDILTAVYQKVTSSLSLTDVARLITASLDMVRTNMSASNLITLAADVLQSRNDISIESAHLPFADTYRGGIVREMWVIEIDFAENIRRLHEFLYGTE